MFSHLADYSDVFYGLRAVGQHGTLFLPCLPGWHGTNFSPQARAWAEGQARGTPRHGTTGTAGRVGPTPCGLCLSWARAEPGRAGPMANFSRLARKVRNPISHTGRICSYCSNILCRTLILSTTSTKRDKKKTTNTKQRACHTRNTSFLFYNFLLILFTP
jgi:hypothetical protein